MDSDGYGGIEMEEMNANVEVNESSEKVELTKEQVATFLENNADTYKEVVDGFLKTETGRNYLQPELDRFFSKGLESWKVNNLDKIVSERVAELNPQETPEQRRIRELEEKLSRQEMGRKEEQLKNLSIKTLSEKGMPTSIAEYLRADTEEGVRNTINNLEIEWTLALDTAVTNRFKEQGKTPKNSTQANTSDSMTKEKLLNMSVKDSTEFYNKNPQLFRQIMNS